MPFVVIEFTIIVLAGDVITKLLYNVSAPNPKDETKISLASTNYKITKNKKGIANSSNCPIMTNGNLMTFNVH